MNNEPQIIDKLKNGDERTIYSIYNEFKPEFLSFASKYNLADEDLLDVYQDAIVALCENARKGYLDEIKSTLKTYFFSIGKYMVFARLKKKKKLVVLENIDDFSFDWENGDDEADAEEQTINNLLKDLGTQCQEILKLFYYEEKKLDEITSIMNYENKDVAKSQKSRCVKQLKQLFKAKNNG